ncbi:hypothetical protein [Terrihalobacillus insolitus]|uniref:hypothetical protein n=1 Tax=Terrihalobacillus insolitus TaxID=2950438 RepID=UPI00233FCD25|nr:hypothetical protein [Terrihalobacillus insolitus]MDC3413913.1 hypothetical protein [Terrihalobacillus insolitus]
MKTYNESQKERLVEIQNRDEMISEVIFEAIRDHDEALPLNLMLEGRFLQVQKEGIELEARIAYLEENDPESEELVKAKRRLDLVSGSLQELHNIGKMLSRYHLFGREFTITEI